MSHQPIENQAAELLLGHDFMSGGGAMGRLLREHDWSATPFGSLDGWPQSLRTAVSICLGTNFPIAIYGGKELALLYNDACEHESRSS